MRSQNFITSNNVTLITSSYHTYKTTFFNTITLPLNKNVPPIFTSIVLEHFNSHTQLREKCIKTRDPPIKTELNNIQEQSSIGLKNKNY